MSHYSLLRIKTSHAQDNLAQAYRGQMTIKCVFPIYRNRCFFKANMCSGSTSSWWSARSWSLCWWISSWCRPWGCQSFAASASSGHSRSPGQQVTSQNVCPSLYPPPQGIQGHQVSRSPARMSVLRCIRLLRAFKVSRSASHQLNVRKSLHPPLNDIQGHQVSRSPTKCPSFAASASLGHSKPLGQQVFSRMSVIRSISPLRPFKVTRSAGQQQNIRPSLHPPPQAFKVNRVSRSPADCPSFAASSS